MMTRRETHKVTEGFTATEGQQEGRAGVLEQILDEVRSLNDRVARWEAWNERRQEQTVLCPPRRGDYLEGLESWRGSARGNFIEEGTYSRRGRVIHFRTRLPGGLNRSGGLKRESVGGGGNNVIKGGRTSRRFP